MATKKKTAAAVGSLGAERPVPVRAGSGPVADRTRVAVHEHQHRPGSQSLARGAVRAPGDGPHTTKSKDGAGPPAGGTGPSRSLVVPPTGGAATSKTPTPVTLDTAAGRALCDVRGTKEFSMPAEVLAKMSRSR